MERNRTIFIIKEKDGFISNTTRNAFFVSQARCEAKKYKRLKAAISMAKKCRAIEVQEVQEDNMHMIITRHAVVNEA